jgi:hypothetical protein
MDVWVTIVVAVIVALSTLSATWLQNRHSSKRLEIELKRQAEVDSHQWRRNVRAEPLLGLRKELAVFAKKAQGVNDWIKILILAGPSIKSKDAVKKIITSANNSLNDFKEYIINGPFKETLFSIDEKEIWDRMGRLSTEYQKILGELLEQIQQMISSINQYGYPIEQLEKPLENSKGIQGEVREIQAMINKKLEEL